MSIFGLAVISQSKLDSLLKKEKDWNAGYWQQRHEVRQIQWLTERLQNAKKLVNDLDNEVLKYKQLYLEEVEKRLALVESLKEK